MPAFDVVVIGAGIGGLCSAALLARQGKRVIVLEAMDVPGGRARTQYLEGCALPRGALAFQTGGILAQICEDVGARFSVRDVNQSWFWLRGGKGFTKLPARGGVRAMLEMFSSVEGGDRGRVATQLSLKMTMARLGEAFSNAQLSSDEEALSFRDWLGRYTDNPGLLALFHSITSAISQVNDHEYPAKHWFAHTSVALRDGRFDRFALLPGGFAAVAAALVQVIQENGGEVRLSSPVERIAMDDGRATGVLVRASDSPVHIPARCVISNVGPQGTAALAGGGAMLGETYLGEVKARVRPTPIVVTFVISEAPLVEFEGSIMFAGLKRIVSGVPLTNTCPEWAPPGKHLMAFYGTPASCRHAMDREAERAANIEDVHTIFPQLAALGGRILDVQLRDIDDPDVSARSWPGYEMPVETPVPNLFNAGDGCAPLGYVATPAAAKSAELAVAAIKRWEQTDTDRATMVTQRSNS